VARGKVVFSSCEDCHAVGVVTDAIKLTKAGPHLNDLFGRKPGDLPDAIYSLAMTRFGKEHIWDEATLTAFLRDPRKVVDGSNMKFAGLKKDEDIKAVLAYLATFDKDGMDPKEGPPQSN
jgi:cytochrome c2